jgi:hypothetical protein
VANGKCPELPNFNGDPTTNEDAHFEVLIETWCRQVGAPHVSCGGVTDTELCVRCQLGYLELRKRGMV